MLGKLRSLVASASRPQQPYVDERPPMSVEELMSSFPPMKPVRPPRATNDDVMAPVYEAVEEALHRAGLLAQRQA
ncbi:hypothetical protein [Methylobacterium sp. J-092]|uniref:hypothetical protein n=1 Tax=Methylobacterium sp. J-092 TaxID=2836667 RepID=UPI001FBAB2D4|nr:hypothetical protein [Methylobacterium sp. J-092]MCJ2009816.1 hypothetical protein [Methylobacterium sp. J-092]